MSNERSHVYPDGALRPVSPPGRILVGIGDIHGCYDPLKALIEELESGLGLAACKRATYVFVGDYIDRGRQTRAVIDYLIGLKARRECVFLRGNHEQTLLDFLDDPAVGEAWIAYGARATFGAYGVGLAAMAGDPARWKAVQRKFRDCLPSAHLAFFQDTAFSYAAGDFLFVHAGVNPKFPLSEQNAYDMMWIREPFLNSRRRFDKFIVHGHSPRERPDLRENRIGIDTGAYATGALSAVIIDGAEITTVTATAR